jgi:hypothetical protein
MRKLLQHQITAKAQRIWFKTVFKYLLSSNDLKGERERERERGGSSQSTKQQKRIVFTSKDQARVGDLSAEFLPLESRLQSRSAQSAHLGLGDWGGESSSPTLLQKFHPSTATLTFWLFIPGSPKTLDSFTLFWLFIPRSPKTLDSLVLFMVRKFSASALSCSTKFTMELLAAACAASSTKRHGNKRNKSMRKVPTRGCKPSIAIARVSVLVCFPPSFLPLATMQARSFGPLLLLTKSGDIEILLLFSAV